MSDFNTKLKAKKMIKQLEAELRELIMQQIKEETKIKERIRVVKAKNSPNFSCSSRSPKNIQFQEQLNATVSKNIFAAKRASIKSEAQIPLDPNDLESPSKFMSPYMKKKKNMF